MKLSLPEKCIYRKRNGVKEMEKKPFNDVDEHYQKHIGTPSSYNMKQMPKPIRIIGYILISFMTVAASLLIILMIWDKIF